MEQNPNNKKIAKNTLIMYIRMFFVMVITLYTVRISLKVLGVEDYGIYNVVAGIVLLMTSVTSALQSAMQRFYAYYLGLDNPIELNRIFSMGIFIYLIIALLIVILGESVGLWFVKTQLIIPAEKQFAAMLIYHISICSFVITILTIPFSALLIANENIKTYAVITLSHAILLLALVYLMNYIFRTNTLILYGALIFCANMIRDVAIVLYCKLKYNYCKVKYYLNQTYLVSVFSYTGWTFWGTVASVANTQGNNILINIFFGPAANAARAVATQVCNSLSVFSNNLFVVVTPPLVKHYAARNYEYVTHLFYLSSKFSYFLLYMLFLPLILETEFILKIWLPDVLEYMVIFTQLSLVYSLILAQHNPITSIVQATGRVKKYFALVETVTLLSLPLTYLLYKLGYPAQATYYVSITIFLFAHCLRVYVLSTLVHISIMEYCKKYVLPVLLVSFAGTIGPLSLCYNLPDGWFRFISVIFASVICVSIGVFVFGLTREEHHKFISVIKTFKFKKL